MFFANKDLIAKAVANLDSLVRAWKSVRAAGGCAGVDGITIEAFETGFDKHLKQIEVDLVAGRYRFSRLKRAQIPKSSGKLRQLGIPTVRDRVVLQAMRQQIEPACEAKMLDCSHAYRPKRGAMTAIAAVTTALAGGRNLVLETDIQNFFDSIRHPQLLRQLGAIDARCASSRLLIQALRLSSSFWSAKKGVAQGSPLSPLLANVALLSFDRSTQSNQWTVVRYADDLIVLSKTEEAVQRARQLIEKQLSELGLAMHPDKTRIVDSRLSAFKFLGFEFHPDRLAPDSANIGRLRNGIASICNPHSTLTWQTRIEQINALMRSFAWYYHQTDSRRLFWTLDQYVAECLAELETQIGAPPFEWSSQVVKMSEMRETHWLGSKRTGKTRKGRMWNGYGS